MDSSFIFRLLMLLHIVIADSKKHQMQSRIFPGKVAKEGQFLYQGYLSYGEDLNMCDGSIIHQRWALTAAHCIMDLDNPTFTVGTIYIDGSDGITYKIEESYPHSKYVSRDGFPLVSINDIALLRTTTDITYNDRVRPIPLARNITANYDYQTALMSGWGLTKGLIQPLVLLYEYVPVMPLCDCSMKLKGFYLNYDLHVCASNANHQQPCKGDSGGPLVLNGEQIGVDSLGHRNCSATIPSIYTKVATYVPWIEDVLAEYGEHI